MELFFFFVILFSETGRLQEVTASPQYFSYEVCQKERERIYYQVPVEISRRVVTPCAALQMHTLPRCD